MYSGVSKPVAVKSRVYVTVQGSSGDCGMFPGAYHPVYPYPYHVITVK